MHEGKQEHSEDGPDRALLQEGLEYGVIATQFPVESAENHFSQTAHKDGYSRKPSVRA